MGIPTNLATASATAPNVARTVAPATTDPPLTAPLLVRAALALSYALQRSDGHFEVAALYWLALAIAICLLAIVVPHFWAWVPPRATLPALLGSGTFVEIN